MRRSPSSWLPSWPSLLPVLLAFGLQVLCWAWIKPLVWLLFYPAVFFSSWMGGRVSGWWATVISIGLVWFFFFPPERSFAVAEVRSIWSAVVFFLHGRAFWPFPWTNAGGHEPRAGGGGSASPSERNIGAASERPSEGTGCQPRFHQTE